MAAQIAVVIGPISTPSAAAASAGESTASHERTPNRWRSHHAATVPGTVTACPPRFFT